MSAAQHLMDYGTQFIKAYDELEQPSWAVFLHFIDAKEDSQTMEGTLDDPLLKFLYSIYDSRDRSSEFDGRLLPLFTERPKNGNGIHSVPCSVWDNTLIIVLPDQGIDYGSYVMSPQGLKEKFTPALHMHLPIVQRPPTSVDILNASKDRWT
jgi:hypothetical protein